MSGEFIQGLFWLLIGIAVTAFSSKYNMGSLDELGPGALPFGLGLVFVFLSLLLIARSWRKNVVVRMPFGPKWLRILCVIALLMAGTFLLEGLGYLLVIFFMIAGPMLIMDRRRWVSALILGVTSSVGSYFLFHVWLNVPLPMGWVHF
jgi:hypothetical protein